MKRTLILAGLVAAAALLPAPAAQANPICVTSGGDPVVCTPRLEEFYEPPQQICVKNGSSNIVCVF